jgi:hypothetical protein
MTSQDCIRCRRITNFEFVLAVEGGLDHFIQALRGLGVSRATMFELGMIFAPREGEWRGGGQAIPLPLCRRCSKATGQAVHSRAHDRVGVRHVAPTVPASDERPAIGHAAGFLGMTVGRLSVQFHQLVQLGATDRPGFTNKPSKGLLVLSRPTCASLTEILNSRGQPEAVFPMRSLPPYREISPDPGSETIALRISADGYGHEGAGER